MIVCSQCGKNVWEKKFLDETNNFPLYWRIIADKQYTFCSPTCSAEWHKKWSSPGTPLTPALLTER
jgi:hypothetical protein